MGIKTAALLNITDMIIKTYKTRELKGFTVHTKIDGKLVSIEFKRGCTLGSTATYVTSDEKIQNYLESLNSFGSDFFIYNSEKVGEEIKADAAAKAMPEPEKEEENEVVDVLDAQTFKNLVELRNALSDKGIDVSQVTNVKAAESLAKKNGYNYTIEKNA